MSLTSCNLYASAAFILYTVAASFVVDVNVRFRVPSGDSRAQPWGGLVKRSCIKFAPRGRNRLDGLEGEGFREKLDHVWRVESRLGQLELKLVDYIRRVAVFRFSYIYFTKMMGYLYFTYLLYHVYL